MVFTTWVENYKFCNYYYVYNYYYSWFSTTVENLTFVSFRNFLQLCKKVKSGLFTQCKKSKMDFFTQ